MTSCLASSSDIIFMQPVFSAPEKPGKSSVTAAFCSSLKALMDTLNCTDNNFVRCLKASNPLAKRVFQSALVLKQLKYTGMLDTLKIRTFGYPSRQDYQEFVDWAKILCVEANIPKEPLNPAVEQMVAHMQTKYAEEVFGQLPANDQTTKAKQKAVAIVQGKPNDPVKDLPVVMMRDWFQRGLNKKRKELLKEFTDVAKATVSAAIFKDNFAATKSASEKAAPLMRALISRSTYLSNKFTYLDTTGRKDLHRVLRAHLARSHYALKRSAHYEQDNRHSVQDYIYATVKRQEYFNLKMKAMQSELIEKETKGFRQQEHVAKEFMADMVAQKQSEKEGCDTMKAEDQYAADIHAAKLAEKYGVEKEGCFLKASLARQRVAKAVAAVQAIEIEAEMRRMLMETHKDVIEKELKRKCLEAFTKMNLITDQSYTKKYMKLPADDEPEGLRKYFNIVQRESNSSKFAEAKSAFDTVLDPRSFDGQQKSKLALKLGSLLGCDPHKVMIQLTPREQPVPTPRMKGMSGFGKPFTRPGFGV